MTAESWGLPAVFCLAAVGFGFQIHQAGRYFRERAWVITARRGLESCGEDLAGNLGVPEHSEAQKRADLVLRIAALGQMPNVSDLDHAVEVRDEARWDGLIERFVVSVLLITGLAGTLWAFQAVLGQPALFDAEGRLDAVRLSDYVNGVYSGLGHAFQASITGILSTIFLLLVRNAVVGRFRHQFLERLHEFTEGGLIPRAVKPPPPLPYALQEASVKFDNAVSKMLSLGEKLEVTVRAANASTEGLRKFGVVLGQAGQQLAETFQSGSPVHTSIDRLAELLNREHEVLRTMEEAAAVNRAKFVNVVEGVTLATTEVKSCVNHVRQLVDASAEASAITRTSAEQIGISMKFLEGILVEEARKQRNTLADLGKEVAAPSRKLEQVSKDLKTLIEELHSASDRHYEMITSVGRSLANDVDRQRTVAEEIPRSLQVVSKQLAPLAELVNLLRDQAASVLESNASSEGSETGVKGGRLRTEDLQGQFSSIALGTLPLLAGSIQIETERSGEHQATTRDEVAE